MRRWLPVAIAALLLSGAPASSPAATRSPVASEDDFLLELLWNQFRFLPKDKRPKVGVALGGGGARGLAHIGVLEVLQEEDVPIDAMAGTSVGALIGALYSAGVSTGDLEEMTQEVGWSSLTNYSRMSLMKLLVTEQGLSSQNMEVYFRKHIGDRRFDQLKIPFACVATDLQTGEPVVFREGLVAPAARASATIPGLFQPVLFRHRYLVDGGLVTNVPVNLVAHLGADIVIAVDVTADFSRFQPRNVLGVLNQAIYIQGAAISKQETSKADVVVRPQLGDIGAMDLTRYGECIDGGVLATRRTMPELKRTLVDRVFPILLRRSGT